MEMDAGPGGVDSFLNDPMADPIPMADPTPELRPTAGADMPMAELTEPIAEPTVEFMCELKARLWAVVMLRISLWRL